MAAVVRHDGLPHLVLLGHEALQLLLILLLQLRLVVGICKLHGSALPVCPCSDVHYPLCSSFCMPRLPDLHFVPECMSCPALETLFSSSMIGL